MKVARSCPRLDGPGMTGELPTLSLEPYSGELPMGDSGLFTPGVRTSSRKQIQNYARGTGKGGVPSHWSVDVTYVDAPKSVARANFLHAQVRNIEYLLDPARVQVGDRIAEWPSAGGEIALRAAERGAGAKVITVSNDHTGMMPERVEEAGLRGAVDVVQMGRNTPSPRELGSDFEAVISVGRLEVFGRAGVLHWLKNVKRLPVDRGTIVVQIVVATEKFDALAECNLDLVRAYVRSQLQPFIMEELRKMVDQETGLRITVEEYIPAHFAATLQLQRDFFAAHACEAAGIGYDRAFRRMWNYYLSLSEALV